MHAGSLDTPGIDFRPLAVAIRRAEGTEFKLVLGYQSERRCSKTDPRDDGNGRADGMMTAR